MLPTAPLSSRHIRYQNALQTPWAEKEANPMANIYDRWHKSRPAPGELRCAKHRLVPSAEHGLGLRWRVQWTDGGRVRRASFETLAQAEWHADHLAGTWCLVPKCGKSAATEPPVLLCADHRDMLVQQATRKKPKVHEPVVYFIRNGSRIKIGWTTNLRQRLSSLSLPASAVELLVPGGPSEENALHGRFSAARIGRTEWFEATEAIEAFIDAHEPGAGTHAGRLLTRIRSERTQAA